MRLYIEKDESYFANTRFDIIDLVPYNKNNKVLEIGCGKGATLLELKRSGKAKYIVGVDIVDLYQEKFLDKFICCNIENEIYKLPFSENFFDVIICADVLEHLIDPWKVVKGLKKYLKSGGYLIASIPNIREIKTMLSIFFKGDFGYQKEGILDKTHLRFFCKKNIIELFQNAGFNIEKITYKLSQKRSFLNKLSFGLLEEFMVIQYLILARKK